MTFNNDYIATIIIFGWGTIMFAAAMLVGRSYERERAKGDLQLYREVYGPGGKPPKPSTEEPGSPRQSAE